MRGGLVAGAPAIRVTPSVIDLMPRGGPRSDAGTCVG
jgi:hypothetical protein